MKIQPPSDYRPDRASLLRKALLAATAALGASACNASAEEPVRLRGVPPPPPPTAEEGTPVKPSEVPTAPKSVDNTGGEAPREPEIVVLGGEIPADPPSTNTVSSATAKPDSGEDDEPLWEGGDVGFDPRSEEGADEPSSDD